MCESTLELETLKRQRKELLREIEILQTTPACHSLEMQRYKAECTNIEWRIIALEQNQISQAKSSTLLSG